MWTRKQDESGQEAMKLKFKSKKRLLLEKWEALTCDHYYEGFSLAYIFFWGSGRAQNPITEVSVKWRKCRQGFDRLLIGVCSTLWEQERARSREYWHFQWDFPLAVKLVACLLSSWEGTQYRGGKSPSLPYSCMNYMLLSEHLS